MEATENESEGKISIEFLGVGLLNFFCLFLIRPAYEYTSTNFQSLCLSVSQYNTRACGDVVG
jgi:hypothetical protein